MTVELLVGSVLGLVTAGASGVAALGVKRLLRQTDELKTKVDEHGVSIAELTLKIPNGEWRAIKADVAAVGAGVTAVSVDVAGLRGELGQHILDESVTLADMRKVVTHCQKMMAAKPRKVARRAARR